MRKKMTEENIKKVKASNVKIVVHGTKEKPYYEIEYFDLSDRKTHVGYSSYELNVVFAYLEKYFEKVEDNQYNNYCYKIKGAKCILDEGILDQIQSLEKDEVKKEGYEEGANDAWNALQMIFFNYDHGGIICEDLKEIFGDISPFSILMNFKSKEVIERLKRYEKEKIHVGDVVVNKHDKGDSMLVTSICDNKFDAIDLSYEEDGEFPACPNMFINDYKKTGQHFDLEEIFNLKIKYKEIN